MFLSVEKKILMLIFLMVILVAGGYKCGVPEGLTEGSPKPITLTWWKVWEEKNNVNSLIDAYQKLHPHIKINYRTLSYEEFNSTLINALAVDRGPDIYSIHTTWMADYKDKITPLPEQISMDYQVIKDSIIKKETFTEKRQRTTLTYKDLRNLFPDVVYNNQYIDNKIYGLPMSIDTLALFSNRDLLNNAGIINPPKTWTEFQEYVAKLTKKNLAGEIIQSGTALGTGNNVERAVDILSLLMLQNGTPMTNSRGRISFDMDKENKAAQALDFYSSFANPQKGIYSWNDTMDNSLQDFINGKVAFFIGYAYHLPTIQSRAPGLNLEISPMPQTSADDNSRINFASYWVETVSNKSVHADEAWDFILFVTTDQAQNKKYLDATKKPVALKTLITKQAEDYTMGAFASQILTAQSWYKGRNVDQAEKIFLQVIEDNVTGKKPSNLLMSDAASKIDSFY